MGTDRTSWRNLKRFFRKKLIERDGPNCKGCGAELEKYEITIDHIKPQELGGQHKMKNFQILCAYCNKMKSSGTQNFLLYRLGKSNCIAEEDYPKDWKGPRPPSQEYKYNGHRIVIDWDCLKPPNLRKRRSAARNRWRGIHIREALKTSNPEEHLELIGRALGYNPGFGKHLLSAINKET